MKEIRMDNEDYTDVRAALEDLMLFNDPSSGKILTKYSEEEEFHLMSAKDLQGFNFDKLALICDVLGMSDIYLNDNSKEK